MENTEIFKTVLYSIIRHFISGFAVTLAAYGLTADQQTAFVSASTAVLVSVVVFLATLGWSYASKWIALHAPPPNQG